MNIYKLHTKPESLIDYDNRLKIPELAMDEIWRRNESDEPYLELVDAIKYDPESAYNFAYHFLDQERFKIAEPYIMKDPDWATRYARNILKERWPEAEKYIMKDPWQAIYYSSVVLKARWPEAEPFIKQNERAYDEYKGNNARRSMGASLRARKARENR